MDKTKKKKIFKVVGCLLAVGIAAVMLTGCENVNIKWQEEVRMAEGEMLLTSRTGKGKKRCELGRPCGWVPEEMSLKVVKLPGTWAPPPVWHKEYIPILLDYQSAEHTWSVVATFHSCIVWRRMGRPAVKPQMVSTLSL